MLHTRGTQKSGGTQKYSSTKKYGGTWQRCSPIRRSSDPAQTGRPSAGLFFCLHSPNQMIKESYLPSHAQVRLSFVVHSSVHQADGFCKGILDCSGNLISEKSGSLMKLRSALLVDCSAPLFDFGSPSAESVGDASGLQGCNAALFHVYSKRTFPAVSRKE